MLIFPAIDLYGGKAVRLLHGDYNKMTVYSDDPPSLAKDFALRGATCLHLVDLEGARDGTTPNLETIKKIIAEKFGGHVPDNMDDLLTLPGVGRKIANLILGDIYHKPAIVADTHCIRISNRWELCDSRDPKKVELALAKLIPGEEQSDFCHRLVLFGRDICPARSPRCGGCPFRDFGCKLK